MDYQELIERLRDTNRHTFALWFEAADALEAHEKRIAELEAKTQEQALQMISDFGQYVDETETLRTRIAELERDSERYRWLRDTLTSAVGGGVQVNDAALVYEESEPGEAVKVYWYPDTPVGFYESKADSLDEAIDAAIAGVKGEQ